MKKYRNSESKKDLPRKSLQRLCLCPEQLFQNGSRGFSKLKDTTLKPTLTLLPNNIILEVNPYETPYIL